MQIALNTMNIVRAFTVPRMWAPSGRERDHAGASGKNSLPRHVDDLDIVEQRTLRRQASYGDGAGHGARGSRDDVAVPRLRIPLVMGRKLDNICSKKVMRLHRMLAGSATPQERPPPNLNACSLMFQGT